MRETIKIGGTVNMIVRAKVRPPADGVHVAGKNGYIKGVKSFWLGDKLCPYGMTAFYFRLNEDTGVKVFYSLKWKTPFNGDHVHEAIYNFKRFAKVGITPFYLGKVNVELGLKYDGMAIGDHVAGILSDHVHYPIAAWRAYAEGHPYNWKALDQAEHPEHNPDGFWRFVRKAQGVAHGIGIKFSGSFKLGDVVYCTKKKRWYLVDTL